MTYLLYDHFNRQLYRLANDQSIPEIENLSQEDLRSYSAVFESASDFTPENLGSGTLVGELELANGGIQSGNYNSGVAGWRINANGDVEFNEGVFRGSVTVAELHIPDENTTAESFHVDSYGNAWWGCTHTQYTSDPENAVAFIKKTGEAKFSDVKVGGATRQFIATDEGMFSFGDGSDGSVTLDGTNTFSWASKSGSIYTMTRDVYCINMDIDSGVTLNPAGYRIFGLGTLTIDGTIERDGNDGGAGTDGTYLVGGTGGTAGAALGDGYLKGSVEGQDGGDGGAPGDYGAGHGNGYAGENGIDGTDTLNSIGYDGSEGGDGGASGSGASSNSPGGVAGAFGDATESNVKLIANWHLQTLLDISTSGSTVKFDNSAGGSSAGGGAGGGTGSAAIGGEAAGGGGGGGASASSGGIIAIYFKDIVISATGTISAVGGTGGDGGDGADAHQGSPTNNQKKGGGGGGGGGAGGNGGQIIIVYNSISNSGTVSVTFGSGGTAGAGGTGLDGGGDGSAGQNGEDGSAGNIRYFKISY